MSEPNIARASMWMALGTVFSRATGLLRLLMLFWAIGGVLNADIFNNANTIPNSMYILVAGGIFNVVLVPQLVRTMKFDTDGGQAYANRVITLGLTVLLAATAVLIAVVPWLLHVVFAQSFFTPELAAQRSAATLLMQLCMPQVFFYGAFVLLGQVLNARGRFGPMMWAPIVNNVIACAMLGLYVAVWGSSNGSDGFGTAQTLLLGLGSTIGIAAQFVTLVPFLRATGFGYRPRFDWRGVGLSHTIKLGAWTLAFIIVNQIAFIVVNRLGTGATSKAAVSDEAAAGSAVYELGFLVSQVPHGIITVSLTTAIMPTLAALAADGRNDRIRLQLGRAMRIAMAIIAPLAVFVACLGPDGIRVMLSFGAISGQVAPIGLTLQCFTLAMVLFPLQYVTLRGFYAREDTRTPFFIQIVIASANIILAVVLTSMVEPAHVAAMLALSFGIAYGLGLLVSTSLLSRQIGRFTDAVMLRFAGRLILACAVTAAVMLGSAALVRARGLAAIGLESGSAIGALVILAIAGVLGTGAYLVSTRLLRIDEVGYAISTVLRRRGA